MCEIAYSFGFPAHVNPLMSLFLELKRRNVFRVGAAYVVVAWLLIQVAETLFPLFGFDETPARIVVILLAIGFFPTLVVAWVFELTPEGLKKDEDVDRSVLPAEQTVKIAKRLDRVIIVVLALALGYFALDKFLLDPARVETRVQTARQEGRNEALTSAYGDKSIAVLPFSDLSMEKNQEYLSDGIAEELLNLLSKIPELRVISRSSAFSFKDREIDIPSIADKLHVDHILEGSVIKVDDNIRIFAKLIEAKSGIQLWSKKYDRRLENIFAIQDDIARDVVDQLKIELLGDTPRSVKTNPAAYTLFLQARELTRQNSEDSLKRSENLLLDVLKESPDYLPAIDELITVYINQAHAGEIDFDAGYNEARKWALEGLSTDSEYGRLHAHLAWIKMFYEIDAKGAAQEFQTALRLVPTNIPVIVDAATFMFVLGRYDEAIKLGEYAIARDPVHPVAFANLANTLTSAGRYDDAIAMYHRVLGLSPEYFAIHYYLGVALLEAGDYKNALVEMQKEPVDGYRLTGLALAHYKLGNIAMSDAALKSLIDTQKTGTETQTSTDNSTKKWTLFIAMVEAYRGATDEAFDWIQIAAREHHPDLAEINTNVLFKNLHGDSRWANLMEGLGKSPEQLASIKFDVTLPE